jgi:hypothetical protein
MLLKLFKGTAWILLTVYPHFQSNEKTSVMSGYGIVLLYANGSGPA